MEWYIATPGASNPIGPLSTELVVAGIKAGRVPHDATVCPVGGTEWQPLTRVPEFGEAALAGLAGPVPATAPVGAPVAVFVAAPEAGDPLGWTLLAIPPLGGAGAVLLPAFASLIVTAVVLSTAALVGVDAHRRKLGVASNALGTAFLWVFVYPAYLRERAKHGAKNLLLPGVGAVFALLGGVAVGAVREEAPLPACDAPEVTTTAQNALAATPAWKAANLQGRITNPGEVRYRAEPPHRVCRAQLTTQMGTETLFYFVEWQNREKNLIWVQIMGNTDDGR